MRYDVLKVKSVENNNYSLLFLPRIPGKLLNLSRSEEEKWERKEQLIIRCKMYFLLWSVEWNSKWSNNTERTKWDVGALFASFVPRLMLISSRRDVAFMWLRSFCPHFRTLPETENNKERARGEKRRRNNRPNEAALAAQMARDEMNKLSELSSFSALLLSIPSAAVEQVVDENGNGMKYGLALRICLAVNGFAGLQQPLPLDLYHLEWRITSFFRTNELYLQLPLVQHYSCRSARSI